MKAPRGRHSDGQPPPPAPCAWALVWSRSRSLGARHSGWASGALQGRETAGRARHVSAAAAEVNHAALNDYRLGHILNALFAANLNGVFSAVALPTGIVKTGVVISNRCS